MKRKKRIDSDKVYQNAKRASDKKRKADKVSGKYYQKGILLNQDITLPKLYRLDELFERMNIQGYKQNQQRIDFNVLLANLFSIGLRKPIAISMSPNNYIKNRYNKLTYNNISKLIKRLESMELIEVKPGYNFKTDSKWTRISATERLLKYCPVSHIELELNPKELVILHDEKKKQIDYPDTAKTRKIRKKLGKANKVNSKANIQFENYKVGVIMKAVFVKKFTWYGRLHTIGTRHVQGMSGVERRGLIINDNRVVELDYSGLHPNLLYAAEGIQFDKDPYSIVDSRGGIVRDYLKVILLAMINAKDFIAAERAGNHYFKDNHEEREELRELGITRARPLMEKFMEAHKPISHYFCQGKETGMRLMNKDAMIALDVVSYFINYNIPIIPVHDSFIIEQQHKKELIEVMQDVYREHTNGFEIGIK